MLAKKKQSILNRLKTKNAKEKKLIVRTNIPQKILGNDDFNLQTMFPSFSLRHINRNNLYLKAEHYVDYLTYHKQNKTAMTKK